MSYFVLRNRAYEAVDWTYRRHHVEDKGLTLEQVGQALDDPGRLVIDPDPRSINRVAGEQACVTSLSRNQVVWRENI